MRRIGVVLILGLSLSGCTSTVGGTPNPTTAAAGSALAMALARVPAADLGSDGYFEFGNSVRLRQLAGTDPAMWKFQVNTGASALADYAAYTVGTIGVDLATAGSALTVGTPPGSVIVLAGGQDGSRITAAAEKSGWTGSGVLARDLDVTKGPEAAVGISLVAPKIRPVGSDVVLSGRSGDPTGVAAASASAQSPADQAPGTKAAVTCLGDVPTAFGTGITSTDPSAWTAAGAGPGTANTASSVLCLGAADTAAANALAGSVRAAVNTGRSKRSGRAWKDLLQSATVEVLPGTPTMVRVTARTATAALVLQMLTSRDIPGR